MVFDDSVHKSGQLLLMFAKDMAKSQGANWYREGQAVSYYGDGCQTSARCVIPLLNSFAVCRVHFKPVAFWFHGVCFNLMYDERMARRGVLC